MDRPAVTGVERIVRDDEIIVSKTDTKGILTYCNQTFMRLAGYSENELLGRPHNIVRHPKMPRCIFKLLWETIGNGREIFAYVVNLSKNGDHYWVQSHMTPDMDAQGRIIGYHSFRRSVERRALTVVEPLYAQLLAEEAKYSDRKEGMAASSRLLTTFLTDKGVDYDQFILGL